MTIPTLSTLPVAPARTDPPATFVTRADAFLAAIVTFQGEMNTSIGSMNTDIATTNTNVTLASEWAVKNDAAVSGTDWSAYANAVGASPTGSSKDWSIEAEDVVVASGEYSSKHYSLKSAASATQSATSETNAATSETNAATSETNAATSETNAAATYDAFDDRYLGSFATDPTTDNDGGALLTGAQYFNTTNDVTRVYNGSGWQDSAALASSVTVAQISDLDANLDSFLKQDGTTAEVISFDSSQYFAGTFSDKVVVIGDTGTAQTINCNAGTVYTATLTGDCTFTLATPNSDTNRATSFTLVLTNDATAARTVAFAGGTFRYPDGSVSRSTDANVTDIWFFFSPDGGTTWYVTLPAKNLS